MGIEGSAEMSSTASWKSPDPVDDCRLSAQGVICIYIYIYLFREGELAALRQGPLELRRVPRQAVGLHHYLYGVVWCGVV